MTYEELLEVAWADDAIVGLVLTGSRGRAFAVTEDPFADPAFGAEALLARLDAIRDGDPAEAQRMFRDVEALAREHALGEVVDGWEPDVAWLRGD
jgi:hypothetical protein